MIAIPICISVIVSAVIGCVWGVFLERDRAVRFPTVADRLPVARVIHQARRPAPLDIRPALRRSR